VVSLDLICAMSVRSKSAAALLSSSVTPLLQQNTRKREWCRISSTLALASSSVFKRSSLPSRDAQLLKPSRQQLSQLFVCSAIPMVGFGFMDNVVMITAGSYVDATLGVTLGVSTLTAAALGNAVSDVSGVLFGGVLERTLSRFKYATPPPLTTSQRSLNISRCVKTAGATIGVFAGCLIGASTLFLCGKGFDKNHSDTITNTNKEDDANAMVEKLIQMHVLNHVKETSIYYCKEPSLWSTYAQRCRKSGNPVRTVNSTKSTSFSEEETYVMCVPIEVVTCTGTKEVVAVVEFIRYSIPFSNHDENIATLIANAASLFLSKGQDNRDIYVM
jgi:hypothetical protein